MHRILVEEKRWVDEDRFLHALKFCTLLPGPEAQQLATYLGWSLHGVRGGLIAGSLFILPGAIVLLGLGFLYVFAAELTVMRGVFAALRPAVLIIVIEALLRIAGRSLPQRRLWWLALGAFVALFIFAVPYPLVVLASALIGLAGASPAQTTPGSSLGEVGWRRAAAVAVMGLALWWGAVLALHRTLGPDHVITQGSWLWSKAAVVTFGGAYAVLDYVRVAAVERFGWLSPQAMLDGLSLAETTPGPLILVLQFVGFVAGFLASDPLSPVVGGLLGAVVALWVTFVPSFLFVLLGAPYVEWLRHQPRIGAALTGISAAVVGVIANLSLWFALHTLFRERAPVRVGPLSLELPRLGSLEAVSLLIAVAAALAMFRYRQSMTRVLAGALVVGILATALGWRPR
jgi:chromate transporter